MYMLNFFIKQKFCYSANQRYWKNTKKGNKRKQNTKYKKSKKNV